MTKEEHENYLKEWYNTLDDAAIRADAIIDAWEEAHGGKMHFGTYWREQLRDAIMGRSKL